MLTACRKSGCKHKGHRKYQGYCELHKDESGWGARQRRFGNRHKRGYGKDWQVVRKQALERDDYICVLCEAKDITTPATTVDHIKAKAHGGDDSLSNLQSLCDDCHKHKTATEGQNKS